MMTIQNYKDASKELRQFNIECQNFRNKSIFKNAVEFCLYPLSASTLRERFNHSCKKVYVDTTVVMSPAQFIEARIRMMKQKNTDKFKIEKLEYNILSGMAKVQYSNEYTDE